MGMMRCSLDKSGRFNSPLGQGRIDKGFDNLEIRLLHAPKTDDFLRSAIFSEYASSGGGHGVSPIVLLDNLDVTHLENLGKKFLDGGLLQFQEADTVSFLIYGCSRGLTHELVRTRKGAWFVQQTMRHSNMGNANLRMPDGIVESNETIQTKWIQSNRMAIETYLDLVTHDVAFQDARTVLPIATETWIIMGMPLRTFLETYAYRACFMFYPEMRWTFRRCGELLVSACPWLEKYVKISCEITKKCEFRGTEATGNYCPLPWSHIRKWTSKHFMDEANTVDVRENEHKSSSCKECLSNVSQVSAARVTW